MKKQRAKRKKLKTGIILALMALVALGIQPVNAAPGSAPTNGPGGSTPDFPPPGGFTPETYQELISRQHQKEVQAGEADLQGISALPFPEITILTNDDMASATVITPPLPYTETGLDTSSATTEAGEPAYDCGWNVGATVWYSYTPSADGYFVIDTSGSSFDTVVHVFEAGSMTLVGCDDDSGTGLDSQMAVAGDPTKTYLISIGGYNGNTGSLNVHLRDVGDFTNCSGVIDVPVDECRALRDLYNAVGGAAWDNATGWMAVNEVCVWFGVECDSGHVNFVNLDKNNLVGTFTADMTDLTQLEYLYLPNNLLDGDFSTAVGLLPTSLYELTLYNNDFTGTIPSALAGFTNLGYLDLWNNQLSGSLSSAVGNLPTNIGAVWLGMNDFTGTIPDMSSFTSLWLIDASNNLLSGDIATVIDNLPTGIGSAGFGVNDFTGTIPSSISGLTNLDYLALYENEIEGDFGTLIDNLPTSITWLYLGSNNFTGNISSSIGSLTNLMDFSIVNNDGLVGTIPLDIKLSAISWFYFHGTFLCEPADPTYTAWAAGLSAYSPGICGYDDADLVIEEVVFTPAAPGPDETFTATVTVRNIGGAPTSDSNPYFYADMYINRVPSGCEDYGENAWSTTSLDPGFRTDIVIEVIGGLPEGTYELNFYVEIDCLIPEISEDNNSFGPIIFNTSTFIFEAYFESGDLLEWTRFNDGSGFLYACGQAAMNGSWGACVERGTNDKRKQLIDETPVDQGVFNARFNFDINSLSMSEGERFRFVQTKMGAERPYFIVLKYQGGQYYIQLNTLSDDLTKTKTGWHLLTDAPHTIEIGWAAASGPGANDGFAELYIDDVHQETLGNLDNDTIFIESFRMGFTSKLVGKTISGIFYIDDVATGNSGYIGLP